MYYELYIDVFFLENFMIDSLLLLAVGHVLEMQTVIRTHFWGRDSGGVCLPVW